MRIKAAKRILSFALMFVLIAGMGGTALYADATNNMSQGINVAVSDGDAVDTDQGMNGKMPGDDPELDSGNGGDAGPAGDDDEGFPAGDDDDAGPAGDGDADFPAEDGDDASLDEDGDSEEEDSEIPVTEEDQNIISITSAGDLLALASAINSGRFVQTFDNPISGAKVRLENDIDLSGIDFEPIGNGEHPFKAEFDGNGFTISNLTIIRENNDADVFSGDSAGGGDEEVVFTDDSAGTGDILGLFGVLGEGGDVHDLKLTGVNIRGGALVGGIAGVAEFAFIRNCEVYGDISSNNALAGGICGYAYESTVEDCKTSGSVSAKYENAGGIAGYAALDNCVIRRCSSNATITVLWGAGGIVGGTANASVQNCSFSGKLVCNSDAVGNIVGDVSVVDVDENVTPMYEVDAVNDTNEI